MALSPRQTKLYRQTADIWRFGVTIDGTGKPSKGWSKIASAVPCYFETGQSQHMPNGEILLGESDNMFTFDKLHFEASVDVRSGDVIKQVSGPDAGNFWKARGNAQTRSRRANKQMILCSRELQPEAGIS